MTSLNILELRGDAWAGDTDLRVIVRCVILELIPVDETGQGNCICIIWYSPCLANGFQL